MPAGLSGLMIAGLLAAFMSTFSGTINAAAAYLVNDVYKRYCGPTAAEREYIRASYVASIAVVIVGCAAGYFTPSVHAATEWIVSALWGGYAAPNVLKWHWWRFNGWGYFWGMMAGNRRGARACSRIPQVNPLTAFPLLLAVFDCSARSPAACSRKAEHESVLLDFYTRTRPWGWWGPIRDAAIRRDPSFEPNRDFLARCLQRGGGRHLANGVRGAADLRRDPGLATRPPIALAIIVVTSTILKFNWYDRLEAA